MPDQELQSHRNGSTDLVEIERKFLVRSVEPDVLAGARAVYRIRQAYLTTGEIEVRVRARDADFFLTLKRGSGLVRTEVELSVSDSAAAEELFAMAGERVIAKRRYLIGPWELDMFEGKLDGLVVLEIELEHADQPAPEFPPGIAVVREVTEEELFRNRRLAQLTWDQAHELAGTGRPP
jgi:adenylate cyclase